MIDERFPKEDGMPPVRLFVLRLSVKSFVNEPSSDGILPVRRFDLKLMMLSSEQ